MVWLFRHIEIILFATILMVSGAVILAISLPNSLLPQVSQPQIVLSTAWPGKTIRDIEQTLVAPLENQLKSLSSLKEMQTSIEGGFASTTLLFNHSADMDQVYIDILARLNQIPDWPGDVQLPQITNYSNGGGKTLASFFLYSQTQASTDELIRVYQAFVEPEFIKARGVASISAGNTPTAKRVDIDFDPAKLVEYGLTIEDIETRMTELVDRSGGLIRLGSLDYEINLSGSVPLTNMANLVIAAKQNQIIRLGDIASVQVRVVRDWDYIALNGHRSLYFITNPVVGVNALEAIDGLKQLIHSLNSGVLAEFGMKVAISRDDSNAIRNSLLLVFGSLALGIFLAAIALRVFIKRMRFVFILTSSIPVCLAFVVVVLYITGRSFNVISLAGMALSIGLILDSGIVVIESVLRLRSLGNSITESVITGTKEVRSAIVSSTLSSIVVFFPVIFLSSVEGQLLQDLAVVISNALLASIFFALVLCPILLRFALQKIPVTEGEQLQQHEKFNFLKLEAFAKNRLGILTGIAALPLAVIIIVLYFPAVDVLPNPKVNSVSTFLSFERPMSMQSVKEEIADVIHQRIENRDRATTPDYKVSGIFCFKAYCLLYFYTEEGFDYDEFSSWVNDQVVHGLVGVNSQTFQGGLLQFVMPDSRSGYVDLKGLSHAKLQEVGRALLVSLRQTFPGSTIREESPVRNTKTQITINSKAEQLAYRDIRQKNVHKYVMALTGGYFIGNFYANGTSIPFYLKSGQSAAIDTLLQTQLVLPNDQQVVLRDLIEAELTAVPSAKLRIDSQESVTLSIVPPINVPIGEYFSDVERHVQHFIQQSGEDKLYVSFRGSADRLAAFLTDFLHILLFAIIVLIALVWMVLRSMVYTLVCIASLVIPVCGGIIALNILALFVPQNMDVITLMGIVILIGVAINNVILIMVKYKSALASDIPHETAVITAVKTRLRPIYMSCATSIFGMLPLMLSPASSSEIYRGLAAILVGGLSVSMVFTPYFVIAMFSFSRATQKRLPLS